MNLNHGVSGMDLWLVWCLIAVNLSGTKWEKSEPFCHHTGRKAQHKGCVCSTGSKFCFAYVKRIQFLFTNNGLMKLAVTLLLFLTVFHDKEGWQLNYQKACNFKFFSNKVFTAIKWKVTTRSEPEELIRPVFKHCTQEPETVDSWFETSQSCW